MSDDIIGKRAQELDQQEIIYRIRIGRRTAIRICIAVLIWIITIIAMEAIFKHVG